MLRSGPKKGYGDIFVFTAPCVKMSLHLFLGSAVFPAHSPSLPPREPLAPEETETSDQEKKIVPCDCSFLIFPTTSQSTTLAGG